MKVKMVTEGMIFQMEAVTSTPTTEDPCGGPHGSYWFGIRDSGNGEPFIQNGAGVVTDFNMAAAFSGDTDAFVFTDAAGALDTTPPNSVTANVGGVNIAQLSAAGFRIQVGVPGDAIVPLHVVSPTSVAILADRTQGGTNRPAIECRNTIDAVTDTGITFFLTNATPAGTTYGQIVCENTVRTAGLEVGSFIWTLQSAGAGFIQNMELRGGVGLRAERDGISAAPGFDMDVEHSVAASITTVHVGHLGTGNATNHARFHAQTEIGGGDPYLHLLSNGQVEWVLGIDRSDGGKFKIESTAGTIGAGINRLTIDTSGNFGIGGITSPLANLHVERAAAATTITAIFSSEESGAGNDARPIQIQNDGAVSITNTVGFQAAMFNQTPAIISYGELVWQSTSTTAGNENATCTLRCIEDGSLVDVFDADTATNVIGWNSGLSPWTFTWGGDAKSHLMVVDGSTGGENFGLFASTLPDWASGDGVMFIGASTTEPSAKSTDAGTLFSLSSDHWFGWSDTIQAFGPDDGIRRTICPGDQVTPAETNGEWLLGEAEFETTDGTANQVILTYSPTLDGIHRMKVEILAFENTNAANNGTGSICSTFDISGGGATVTEVQETQSCQHGNIPGTWQVATRVNAGNIEIVVTGQAATTIHWRAFYEIMLSLD